MELAAASKDLQSRRQEGEKLVRQVNFTPSHLLDERPRNRTLYRAQVHSAFVGPVEQRQPVNKISHGSRYGSGANHRGRVRLLQWSV